MRRRHLLGISIASVLCVLGPTAGAAAGPGSTAASPRPSAVLAPDCAVDLAGLGSTGLGAGCPASLAPAAAGIAPAAPGDAVLPCAVAAPKVDDRCETWSTRYHRSEQDTTGDGIGGSELVASAPAGDTAYVLGTTDVAAGTTTDHDLVVIAHDAAAGTVRWSTIVPTDGVTTEATSVVANPVRSEVYALGHDTGDGMCDATPMLIALDATTGARRWAANTAPSTSPCQNARAVQVDPSGDRLFVVGASETLGGHRQSLITAYDTTDGSILWHEEYRSPADGSAVAAAVAISPDGRSVYVGAGNIDADSGRTMGWSLLSYDAATGARAWVERWDAPKPLSSTPANPPAGIVVSPDGSRVYVVGGAEVATLFDIVAMAHDAASGARLWVSSYEGIRSTIKSSFDSVWYHRPLAISPDGSRLFIAGYSTSLHGANLGMDFVALALDATDGSTSWTQRHTGDEWIHWVPSAAVSPDGRTVYLSGQGRHFHLITATYETFAYDAVTGDQRWTSRISDGLSYWGGMALSPDGEHLFVTGSTVDHADEQRDGRKHDVLTVAYPAG